MVGGEGGSNEGLGLGLWQDGDRERLVEDTVGAEKGADGSRQGPISGVFVVTGLVVFDVNDLSAQPPGTQRREGRGPKQTA